MKVEIRQNSPDEADLQRLAELLENEESQYRRLLRLAWRQNSYMKRQDVDRLETNAREWNRYLPLANQARSAREKFLAYMGGNLGLGAGQPEIQDLLVGTRSPIARRIAQLLVVMKGTALRLARQNELNRALAEFCLDLVREESEIFKRCVLDDPSGCYGEDALRADRGPGGVLVKQA